MRNKMTTNKKAIILFSNHPHIEVARKRISGNISYDENVLRAFLNNTFEVLSELKSHLDYHLIVATDKQSIESEYFQKLAARFSNPIEFQLLEQNGHSFDERIKNSLQRTFEREYSKVVIIGNDCPDLTTGIIDQAFQDLEEQDIVIGPSNDGGFYLLGLNCYHPDLFSNIQWYSEKVFSQLYENALAVSNKIGLVSPLSDIDSKDELIKWFTNSGSIHRRFLFYVIYLALFADYFPLSFDTPFAIKNHHMKRLWQKSPPFHSL